VPSQATFTLDSCHVSCAPIFGAHSYTVYMLYLHVSEACRSSPSPLPTILLPSPQFPYVSHSPYFHIVQQIFDNALKAYKKRTKNDLLTHPLAHRLKACDSASSIRTVLVGPNQSTVVLTVREECSGRSGSSSVLLKDYISCCIKEKNHARTLER